MPPADSSQFLYLEEVRALAARPWHWARNAKSPALASTSTVVAEGDSISLAPDCPYCSSGFNRSISARVAFRNSIGSGLKRWSGFSGYR